MEDIELIKFPPIVECLKVKESKKLIKTNKRLEFVGNEPYGETRADDCQTFLSLKGIEGLSENTARNKL